MFKVPHAVVKTPNPVFHYLLRRAGRLGQLNRLIAYNRFMVVGVLALMILWWGFILFSDITEVRKSSLLSPGEIYRSDAGLSVSLLFVIGFGIMVVGDVWYAAASSTSINDQIRAGQWDLLRLTHLPESKILTAVYAVSQLRAWRMLMVEVAIRLAPLVFFAIELVLPSRWLIFALRNTPIDYFQSSPFYGLTYDFWGTVALMSLGVIASAVYVLEPLWRMRAVTALGMAVSAQVRSAASATVVTIIALLAMRLVQAVFLATLVYLSFVILTATVGTTYADYSNGPHDTFGVFVVVICIAFGLVAAIYGFYRIVAASAFNYTLSRAFFSE